jgi:hypothetical protein
LRKRRFAVALVLAVCLAGVLLGAQTPARPSPSSPVSPAATVWVLTIPAPLPTTAVLVLPTRVQTSEEDVYVICPFGTSPHGVYPFMWCS